MASSTTPPGTPPSEAPPLETPPLSPEIPPHQSQDETLPSTSIPQKHGSAAAAAEGSRDIQSKEEHHQKHDPSQTLNPTLKTYLSQSNDHIHHLNRLLTTTPSVDLILSTTSYTLALLSTLLPSDPNIPLTRAQPLHHRLSNLSSLLSETRTTLRLFGLIPIYTWAHSTYHSPNPNSTTSTPSTLISRYITTTQILAGIAFQILENLAYLGDKNILPISAKRRSKYWLWCCRAWTSHVFLELAKSLLLRGRFVDDAPTPAAEPIDAEKSSIGGVEQTTQIQDQRDLAAKNEQEESWWQDMKINLAYAPMTLHYSLANGLLNDSTVALCGVLASYWGLKDAWIRTAET